jgi:hypothetical protein
MKVRALLQPIELAALAAVALLAFSTTASSAQPEPAPGNCQRCHASGVPLPDKHPKVKGSNIAECASCHASLAAQAKAHPFAARLHRAHVKAGVDCTTCHTYAPGKRFALSGSKGNLGALDAEQYERVRKAMLTWADGPVLASMHGSKGKLSCGACHDKALIPDDNESVINKRCAGCHGGYDKVAAISKGKLKNPHINPHASHLGPEIACTVCHQGHQESKPYCVNCHTNFDMPIPGGSAKPAAAAATKK